MKITGAKSKYIGNGGMFGMIPVVFSSFFFFFRTNHPIPPFPMFSTRKINVDDDDDDDDDDIMGYNVTRPIFHWIMGVVMGE